MGRQERIDLSMHGRCSRGESEVGEKQDSHGEERGKKDIIDFCMGDTYIGR